ncbi:hypothetical protein BDR07DRAFT_1493400 [Suillus spraguei]|nr:hypothetical protein BDR07DRAFT_1493400 [Suillus spraguei]
MRIVDPTNSATLRRDGESSELQFRGGRYRTGNVGIIKNGVMCLSGHIKDTVIVHGVSYGIPELETHLWTAEGVTPSFLAAAPDCAPSQETEEFIIFHSPMFDLNGADASAKLFAMHRAIRDICDNGHPATSVHRSDSCEPDGKDDSGEARGATFVAPSSETEKALAKIYAGIFNLAESETLASDNFFELGGTSIDVIRLKREGSSIIVHSDYHSCQC